MARIETVYLWNHSHTDIGFTDHQDLCFRQHAEFVEQALDLCEATAGHPPEAQFRWTCEVTGPTERYLRAASPGQRERFRRWHEAGAIEIGAMQYNLTPLLTVEQLHRSLYPVRRLREEFGLSIETAMQSDVDGVSWLFADLLPQAGIDFLTMAINPMRGRAPQPRPSAFWWEGPSGGRVLVWNGYHYLFGRSVAKLGDWRFVEQSLPAALARLERDPDYPFDWVACQTTHPMRVDNGPPDPRLPDFVRDWNAAGRTPRLCCATPSQVGRLLRERFAGTLPVRRGDWTDWWADGVASSAAETGLNRTSHELFGAAEALGAWLVAHGDRGWDGERARSVQEQLTLYDEHTWGAFASVAEPQDPWTKAQWNRKAGFAYAGWAQTHDLLARSARAVAGQLAEPGPEGRFNLGDLDPAAAYPASGATDLLVLNTLPWEREVLVDVPESRGGAAPAGLLDQFMPRGVPWAGERPAAPFRRVAGRLPALGAAFLPLANEPDGRDLVTAPGCLENERYRVRVDAAGGLAEWYDKALDHDFAGRYRGWGIGQYVEETVGGDQGRAALFADDFSDREFGYGRTDTPFRHAVPDRVSVGTPVVEQGVASLELTIRAPGVHAARCRFALPSGRDELWIDWQLDKAHVTDPEAVFVAFPFQLGRPTFLTDLNGVPCRPNDDQLPGSVRDWYPVQRWADVSDGERGVTLVPLEAPLLQLGGITTGRWASTLEAEAPAIMSWALHNHWPVNFRASQGGEIRLRYLLTTHAGPADAGAAARFAAEQSTPPITLADYRRAPDAPNSAAWLRLQDDGALLGAKPAEDGDGIILRVQNLCDEEREVRLVVGPPEPISAHLASPLEAAGRPLAISGGGVAVPVGARGVQTCRLRFA
ncbi:MAG: hypothetical protein WAM30_00965, partial [Candidatus Dormiibacterota bacterium]